MVTNDFLDICYTTAVCQDSEEIWNFDTDFNDIKLDDILE